MTDEEKHPEVTEEAAEQEAAEEGVTAEQTAEAGDLQLQLEDARAKVDEHWDQILRLQAELDNTRRRAERDVENAHKYALERFTNELLPVKDSLELGLQAAAGEEGALDKLREGTELTLKMLGSAMEKFGIKEVDPAGEPFDPQLHQAMTMQESREHTPNTVVAVMQKGYLLNDRLIRPAMVVVATESSGEPGEKLDEKA
jgi:molecular chaperone GrpE